jgi:pyruvate dehydrogenase E1 component alpha subunit
LRGNAGWFLSSHLFQRERSSGLSENPLLPHNKLRALHSLMLRCRELERKQKSRSFAREALLAATSIHLLPGDLLSASPADQTSGQLAPEARKPSTGGSLIAVSSLNARLPLCAAAARGLQAAGPQPAGTDGVVLAFAQAGATEPGWRASLEWAQQSQLPLLLVCADATGGARSRSAKRKEPALDFATISRFAKRLELPVLTVDGEDAVAIYRVMQESVLRARLGGGPAVLWAVMTPLNGAAPKMPRSSQPIARLESYMAERNISFAGK